MFYAVNAILTQLMPSGVINAEKCYDLYSKLGLSICFGFPNCHAVDVRYFSSSYSLSVRYWHPRGDSAIV